MTVPEFTILQHDDQLVAVNKPSGLLVHRYEESIDRVFLLQLLRRRIGQPVWPVHRLDRATSGVVVFALSADAVAGLHASVVSEDTKKCYLALLRGDVPEEFESVRELTSERGVKQTAHTSFTKLLGFDRASLVRVRVHGGGRRHQIRRHANHLVHHVFGDTTHGKGRDNRMYRERYGLHRLALHASSIECVAPNGAALLLRAPLPSDFFDPLQRIAVAAGVEPAILHEVLARELGDGFGP